jgi:YcxB-like protein
MELHYSLTPSDQVELSLDAVFRMRPWVRYIVPVAFALLACFFLFEAWQFYVNDNWLNMTIFLTFIPVSLLVGIVFWRPLFRLSLALQTSLQFDQKLNRDLSVFVAPNSFTVKNAISETSTGWDGVEHIASTSNHLFIYLSKRTAFVVPARAFKRTEEFQAFVDQVRGYHEIAVARSPSDHGAGAEGGG